MLLFRLRQRMLGKWSAVYYVWLAASAAALFSTALILSCVILDQWVAQYPLKFGASDRNIRQQRDPSCDGDPATKYYRFYGGFNCGLANCDSDDEVYAPSEPGCSLVTDHTLCRKTIATTELAHQFESDLQGCESHEVVRQFRVFSYGLRAASALAVLAATLGVLQISICVAGAMGKLPLGRSWLMFLPSAASLPLLGGCMVLARATAPSGIHDTHCAVFNFDGWFQVGPSWIMCIATSALLLIEILCVSSAVQTDTVTKWPARGKADRSSKAGSQGSRLALADEERTGEQQS